MRSVFIYVKSHSLDQIRFDFASNFSRSDSPHYDFALASHDKEWGLVYLTNKVDGMEEEDFLVIRSALGAIPSIIVIDVTGRWDCRSEVREFVFGVLQKYDGVTQDDYSTYLWKAPEIGLKNVEGRSFFEPA